MSSFNVEKYIQRKERIIHILRQMTDVTKELQVGPASKFLEKSIEQLQGETFKVVVVGEFSRGKSTFINALLGSKILPVSNLPTTTILNKIHYSDHPEYKLTFRDESKPTREITREDFANIVAPPEPIPGDKESEEQYDKNIEFVNNIAWADIGQPIDICHGGVEIIDTPGTNDLDAAREEITYKFIPESDAAVLILHGTHPLADSEMRFLKERILTADIQKVFFIVNFKDRLRTEEDQKKVMDYITKHLQPVVGQLRLFLVSAKGALSARRVAKGETVKGKIPQIEETGFLDFEEELSLFLSKERGAVKLAKPIDRGIRIATETMESTIDVSLGSLSLNLPELEEKIALVQKQLVSTKRNTNEVLGNLRSALEFGGQGIRKELELELKQIGAVAATAVQSHNGPLSKDEVTEVIQKEIGPLQHKLHKSLEEKKGKLLDEELERVGRRLEYEWREVQSSIKENFSANLPSTQTSSNVSDYAINNDETGLLWKAGLTSVGGGIFTSAVLGLVIPFALPLLFFGGLAYFGHLQEKKNDYIKRQMGNQIEENFRKGIPQQLMDFDKHWRHVQDKTIESFEDEMDRRIDMIEEQLVKLKRDYSLEKAVVEEKKQFFLKKRALLITRMEELQGLAKEIREELL